MLQYPVILTLYADGSLPLWPVVGPVGPSSFSETLILCDVKGNAAGFSVLSVLKM